MARVGIVGVWYARGAGFACRTIANALKKSGRETSILVRRETRVDRDGPWTHPRIHVEEKPGRRTIAEWVEREGLSTVIVFEERDKAIILGLIDAGCKVIHVVMEDQVRESDIEDGALSLGDRSLIPGPHMGCDFRLPSPREIDWPLDGFPPPRKTMPSEQRAHCLFVGGWSAGGKTSCRKNGDALAVAWKMGHPKRLKLVVTSQTIGAVEAFKGLDDVQIIEGELPESEVRDLAATAEFVVCPHRRDGLGLDLFGAVAMGVPVVAPIALSIAWKWAGDAGVPADSLLKDKSGYVLPDVEVIPEALSAAIKEAWERRAELRDLAGDQRERLVDREQGFAKDLVESLG